MFIPQYMPYLVGKNARKPITERTAGLPTGGQQFTEYKSVVALIPIPHIQLVC